MRIGDLTIDPDEIIAVKMMRPEGLPHPWVCVWTRAHRFELAEQGTVAGAADALYERLAFIVESRNGDVPCGG